MTKDSEVSKKSSWTYVCLDSLDDEIENEILGKDRLCVVKMLGAKSAADLDDNILKEADVVAVWHTIYLDASLLGRLKKPPKVENNFWSAANHFRKTRYSCV